MSPVGLQLLGWSKAQIEAIAEAVIAGGAGAFDYKGAKACGANPKYPAGKQGYVYIVSEAGKIGGASGEAVEVGDLLICKETAGEGTQAEVGSEWDILQVAGIIAAERARAEAAEALKEVLTNKSTDGTLGGGSPSSTLYPTQKAVSEAVAAVAITAGTSLEKVGNKLSVAAGGIGEAEIGTGAATGPKIGNLNLGRRFQVDGYIQSSASRATGQKKGYWLPVKILHRTPITGITFEIGSTHNGEVIGALYGPTGKRLAKSAAHEQTAQNEAFERLPFEAAPELEPGLYWLYYISSSTTGTAICQYNINPWSEATESAFEAPEEITVPTELNNSGVKAPVLGTY